MENEIQWEKMYFNGIPVYRAFIEDEVTYRLFENQQHLHNEIRVNKGMSPMQECQIILSAIVDTAVASGTHEITFNKLRLILPGE